MPGVDEMGEVAGEPGLDAVDVADEAGGVGEVDDVERGFQPGAPSASNGIVPTSSQRTRSPRNTGPSTQARTILVTPSELTAGSTHPMHRPVPHIIAGSVTSACTGSAYRPASEQTARRTPSGADA